MNAALNLSPAGCGCDADRDPGQVSIDEALRRIARFSRPVGETPTVPLHAAHGRVLAGPVTARAPVPAFDNSAMDGYALDTRALAGDGPWRLGVAGRIAAGQGADGGLPAGAAVRIFTGAPIPPGADAVVRQEDVTRSGGGIVLQRRPAPGLNIRRVGEDMAAGAVILEAGRRIGPRDMAACAAAGCGEVTVRRTVRVALLVTGDEVRAAGDRRNPADTWDVNTPMIAAALTAAGAEIVDLRRADDDREGIAHRLALLAAGADLVVTTGGISVGEEDHVRPALDILGAEVFFSGVAMKPGKPVSFGRLGSALWLGLPGNPLSAFVTWQLFGTALMRSLSGCADGGAPRRHVVTDREIRRTAGRCELRPARIAGFDGFGREVAQFEDATHSGRVAYLSKADGLLFLPAEAECLPRGALVEFQPFHDF